MGDTDNRRRTKALFVELPAAEHADVFLVAKALKYPSAAAFVRKAVRRALYEARKEPIAA
jgi:hypothetical protein